jgi:hypothetical protein
LQSNAKAIRTFVVRHSRDTQAGGYELSDERDIYELLANMAARRVRACLEEVIDADIVEKAIDQCRVTLKQGEKLPIKDRAAKVLLAFSEFGVTQEMIEKRIGNKMDAVSENQLASLRRIYKALSDGVGKREDYFKPDQNFEAPKFKEEPESKAQEPAPKAQEPEIPPQEPEPSKQEPAPKTPEKMFAPESGKTGNQLRLLRELCKVSKIKEPDLLRALEDMGVTSGGFGSLEDIALSSPAIITATIKDWATLSKTIKEFQKSS